MKKPEKEWLTVKDITEAELLGEGKSRNAVRLYIQRHRLSDHPTLCRKAPGKGSALEYHSDLFTPEAFARRKKRRGRRDEHRRRGTDIIRTAEGGKLRIEVALSLVATGAGELEHLAEKARSHCIERFGETIMKANDPLERVPMPPLRTFVHYIQFGDFGSTVKFNGFPGKHFSFYTE